MSQCMSHPKDSFLPPLSQALCTTLHRGHLSHPSQSPRQSLQMLLSQSTSVKGAAILGINCVSVREEFNSTYVSTLDAWTSPSYISRKSLKREMSKKFCLYFQFSTRIDWLDYYVYLFIIIDFSLLRKLDMTHHQEQNKCCCPHFM